MSTREVIKMLWHSDRPIAERILVFPVIFLYTLFAFFEWGEEEVC